jgi:carbohydrate kinase (thermoresistant glucokinase family)
MRWPWLDRLADAVNDQRQKSVTVFGCSALRKSYRDRLRAAIPDLKIAYLEASQDVLAMRLAERKGHYMPASLLARQYDTLDVPENATVATSANQPIAQIIQIFKSAI